MRHRFNTRGNLSLRLLKIFRVPFAAQKNQNHFLLFLCECWHLLGIMPRFKLLRHSLAYRARLQGGRWRFKGHTLLFKHAWCKDWIWNWLHIVVRSDAGRGPPRSPAKGSKTLGMTHYAAHIQFQLQQLIMWKENITIVFFSMTKGDNFLLVQSCFQQIRGFYPMEKAGGDFWDLNYLDRP